MDGSSRTPRDSVPAEARVASPAMAGGAGSGFHMHPVANGAVIRIDVHEPCIDFGIAEAMKSRLKDATQDCLAEGHRAFVLDLSAVNTVDSSGVGVLISVHHQVVGAGGTLAVVGVQPFVMRVLKLMRLEKFLQIFADPERALRLLVESI